MIIQCTSCQTKFKLADEKVGPTGVSVRCSKCGNTFPVRPPAAGASAPAPAPPTPSGMFSPPPTSGSFQSAPKPPAPPPMNPAPMPPPPGFGGGFAPPPSGPTFDPAAMETRVSPGQSFGAGDPFAAAAGAPDPFAPPPSNPFAAPPAPSNPFAPPATSAPPNPFAPPPANGADGGDAELPPTLDPSVRAALLGSAPGAPPLSGPDADAGGGESDAFEVDRGLASTASTAPAAPPAPEAAPDLASPIPPRTSADKPLPGGRPAAARKRAPSRAVRLKMDAPREPRSAMRLLLLLFFAGGAIGAFASLTNGTLDPEQIDRARLALFIGPPPAATPIAGLTMTATDGGYVDTLPGRPRVFVASGLAINASGAPKGFFEVRGTLKDASGKSLAQTTVPCGNSFRDDQLRSLSSGEELKRAYTDKGDGLSNAKVAPGAAIRCMVVFFDAPPLGQVSQFELEIVDAKPVS